MSFEQDRSGNRVTYTYTQDAVAKTDLLSRIAYNGYSVEFVYELKGDTSSGYIAPNTLLAEQHRLTQVLVKAGSVLTSYYRIGYQLSSNPSLVEKIEQCSASTCFPATRFAYELNGQDGTFNIQLNVCKKGIIIVLSPALTLELLSAG